MIIITRKEQESPRGQLRGNNMTCEAVVFDEETGVYNSTVQ